MDLPDFTYKPDGMFVLIMPENKEAIQVWNTEIAGKTDGTGKVLAAHFPAVKDQLRAAGYTVRLAHKSKESDADLLEGLL